VKIAVFDSGADNGGNTFTDPFCTTHDLTPITEDPDTFWHGCCVTSAALYGELPNAGTLPMPPAHVDHYRVWPPPDRDHDFELDWILDRVKDTVEANSYPIVNLSLGPDVCVDDGAPHRWTAELDRLAWEHGVVFVAAAGNNGNESAAHGLNRVQVPADMANGIAVGACTTPYPQSGWVRSDYSAVGPGREGSHARPTVVSYGGHQNGPHFEAIGPRGELVRTWGTSMAAPVVAHELASLAAQLPPSRRTSNNLRVFAGHFAERTRGAGNLYETGFGRMRADLDDVLECSSDELTLLYEGQAPRDQVIGVPLPLPPGTSTKGTMKVRWTLAVVSPTNPADAVDYTSATIEVTFRPNSSKYTYKDPITKKLIQVDSRKQPDLYARLTAQGVPPSLNPVTRSVGAERAPEWARRGGGKWDTVKRGSLSLRASTLYQPRFDLTYLARWEGALLDIARPLEFSLLVTITGPSGSNIYDRIRAQLPQLPTIRQRVQPRIRQST
jgi:subtilisin family serine protease